MIYVLRILIVKVRGVSVILVVIEPGVNQWHKVDKVLIVPVLQMNQIVPQVKIIVQQIMIV